MSKIKRPWKIHSVLMGILFGICVAFIFLTLWEVGFNQNKQLESYRNEQEETNRMLLALAIRDYREGGSEADAVKMCESMQAVITEGFVTSSSSFCYVGKEDEILFLRDERSLDEIKDMTHSDLWKEYSDTCVITEKELTVEDEKCYVGIITRNWYIESQMGLFALKIHVVVYLILITAFAVALVALMRARVVKLNTGKYELERLLQTNREAIDELQKEKDEHNVIDPTTHTYGVVNGQLVESVIAAMSDLQKAKSCVVSIYYRDAAQAAAFGALLERSMNKRYIGCYREPASFYVLLMNTGKEEAERYQAFLTERMVTEYGFDAKEFVIEVTRLV